MIQNAFIGKPKPPTDGELTAALGAARKRWDQLLAALAEAHGLTDGEWSSYSKKAGWSLRLKQRDRVIVYLTPGNGEMAASFALGEAAMEAARRMKLPAPIVKVLDEAKRYAEGFAVRLEVKTAADTKAVVGIAGAKIG